MKRIAFLGRGGHTLPTYRAVLNRIADQFELVVYSEVPVDMAWLALPHKYVIREARGLRIPIRRIREFLFLMTLVLDHLAKPFDLVHSHSTYPTGFAAIVLQRLFGVPAIVSLHAAEGSAIPHIGFGDLLHRRRARVNRWVIDNAKTVTALTNFHRKEVSKNLQIDREIIVIPRGVELGQFFFERRREIGSRVVFLSVGYLNSIKDPETLIKGFYLIQKHVHGELVVVGMDYTKGRIAALVHRLGIEDKVTFAGFVDHNKLQHYYRRADVLLHTSLYESEGMVVVEAMASGTLVCGSNVGLMNDLSGECCVTVRAQQPQELADAVLLLLRNKDRVSRLRTNAYEWIKNHDLEQTLIQVTRLYDQLLNPDEN